MAEASESLDPVMAIAAHPEDPEFGCAGTIDGWYDFDHRAPQQGKKWFIMSSQQHPSAWSTDSNVTYAVSKHIDQYSPKDDTGCGVNGDSPYLLPGEDPISTASNRWRHRTLSPSVATCVGDYSSAPPQLRGGRVAVVTQQRARD